MRKKRIIKKAKSKTPSGMPYYRSVKRVIKNLNALRCYCNRCEYEWIPSPRSGKVIEPLVCPSCHSPGWNRTDMKKLAPWWERKRRGGGSDKRELAQIALESPKVSSLKPAISQVAIHPIPSNIQVVPIGNEDIQTPTPKASELSEDDIRFASEIKTMCRQKATRIGASEADLKATYSQISGGLDFDISNDVPSLDKLNRLLANAMGKIG